MNLKQPFLMFIPLLLGFVGLFFAIQDLKHPISQEDQCRIVGRGLSIQNFKATAKILYRRTGKNEDDIAFTCKTFGDIVINDSVPLVLKESDVVHLTAKHYHYFPTRYSLLLPVINTKDVSKQTSPH